MADPKDDKLEFENFVLFIIVHIWIAVTTVLSLSYPLGYSYIRQNPYRIGEFCIFSILYFWLEGKVSQYCNHHNFLRDNKPEIFIFTFLVPFFCVFSVYQFYSHWSNKIDDIHREIKSIAKIQEIQGDFNIEKARQNIIIGKP